MNVKNIKLKIQQQISENIADPTSTRSQSNVVATSSLRWALTEGQLEMNNSLPVRSRRQSDVVATSPTLQPREIDVE